MTAAWAIGEPSAEVRGTWLSTTGNDALATPANTAQTMKRLREIGLNTVYVECWKNGYTEFPSETLKRAIGVDHKLNLPDQPADRDLLREALIEAHRNQLLCFAWFEYGFMAAHQNTDNELARKREWLSQDIHGNDVARNGFIWLNPLRPECQDLIIGIVLDAIKNYDLDGVQLDDRICWAGLEMGYDAYTRKAYAQEHDGKQPPDDPYDKDWIRWRADKVTQFAKRLVTAIRKENPKTIISLSPAPYPYSYDVNMCDWPAWAKWDKAEGFDEFVPQCYQRNFADFERCWKEQLVIAPNRKADIIAGIALDGEEPIISADDAMNCAGRAREDASGGHCWWYSRGVLGPFEKEIRKLYDAEEVGYAPHPKRAPDWRPEPVVAQVTQDKQHFAVRLDRGRYRVIFKRDDHWEESPQPLVVENEIVFDPKIDAKQIEFLVDRRP